jgi:hypothetical protein
MSEDPTIQANARTRAHMRAVQAALATIAEYPNDSVMFNQDGAIGLVIAPKYNIMELASYMDVRRVGHRCIVLDQEVIMTVLTTGALCYQFINAEIESYEEQGIAPESLPQVGEGADVLSIPEPRDRPVHLVGIGPGESLPRSESPEHTVLAFERR